MKKMQRLYKLYPPAQNLSRRDLPNGTKRIPVTKVPDRRVLFGPKNDFDPMEDGPYLRNYGWAFTDAFAFDYAYKTSQGALITCCPRRCSKEERDDIGRLLDLM